MTGRDRCSNRGLAPVVRSLVDPGRSFSVRIAHLSRLCGALLAVALLSGCDKAPDADGQVDVDITPRPGLVFPDTDAGRAVASHLETMLAIGPDAENNYQASLQALREKPGESVTAIVETYEEADKALYFERAILVETLAELRVAQARDPLLRITNAKLPERQPLPDDTYGPIQQETIVRMTAIRGLGNLAFEDDVAARRLGVHAEHREIPLREQARQSLAEVIVREREKVRLKWLVEIFPGDYRDWLVLTGVAPPAP